MDGPTEADLAITRRIRYTGQIPPHPLPTLLVDAIANQADPEAFCRTTSAALERAGLSLTRPNPWEMSNVLITAIEYTSHLMDLAMGRNRNRIRWAQTQRGQRFPAGYTGLYQNRGYRAQHHCNAEVEDVRGKTLAELLVHLSQHVWGAWQIEEIGDEYFVRPSQAQLDAWERPTVFGP